MVVCSSITCEDWIINYENIMELGSKYCLGKECIFCGRPIIESTRGIISEFVVYKRAVWAVKCRVKELGIILIKRLHH